MSDGGAAEPSGERHPARHPRSLDAAPCTLLPVTRRRRVLAIGWFGENNLGDDAMLSGLLRLLDRSLGSADVTVATRDPADTAAAFGTRTIRRSAPADSGFTNLDLLWATLRADLVTLGGGDLIREQADGVVPALNWLSRVRVPLRLRRSDRTICGLPPRRC